MTKKIKISFVVLLLFGIALWLFFILKDGISSYQFNVFFSNTQNYLADLTNVIGYSAKRNPYNCLAATGLAEKAYPPMSYFITYFLSKLVNIDYYYSINGFTSMYVESRFNIIIFIIATVIVISCYELFKANIRGSKPFKIGTTLVLLFSSPFIFALERGNLILLAFLASSFYIFYYDSDNKILKELSLLSLAFAASLKLTPAILGILLIFNKDYKSAIRCILYGILMFILPFLFFKGGLTNITLMFRNLQLQLQQYAQSEGCTLYSTFINVFGLNSSKFKIIATIITYVTSIVLLLNAFLFDDKYHKVISLSLIMVILPSHSEYYNILFLLPSVVLMLNKDDINKLNLLYFIPFFMILFVYQFRFINIIFNYHIALLLLMLISIITFLGLLYKHFYLKIAI